MLPEHITSITQVKQENGIEPKVPLTDHIGSLDDMVINFEGELIEQVLNKNNGNKTKTAKELGISVRNLYYKLDKYNSAKNSTQ